jgi:hypothetical protein
MVIPQLRKFHIHNADDLFKKWEREETKRGGKKVKNQK